MKKEIKAVGSKDQYWFDEFGVQYSMDKTCLIKAPDTLVEYVIKKGTTKICEFAFVGCNDLAKVSMPDSVRYIESGAFEECFQLNSINISNSVTRIGSYAFSICKSLTEIVLPDRLEEIGDGAFDECHKLTSINIPDSVTTIGDNAFSYCENLTEIVIPANVKKIGEGAFEFCCSLKHISVNDDNDVYDSRNNCNAIIHTATNTLIAGCINTVIPKGVKRIGSTAFTGRKGIETITIPEGVTKVGFYSFFGCKLKSITLPTTIKEISDWTLYVSDAIYVPDGMQDYYFEKLPQYKDQIRIKMEKKNVIDAQKFLHQIKEDECLRHEFLGDVVKKDVILGLDMSNLEKVLSCEGQMEIIKAEADNFETALSNLFTNSTVEKEDLIKAKKLLLTITIKSADNLLLEEMEHYRKFIGSFKECEYDTWGLYKDANQTHNVSIICWAVGI